MSFINNVSNNRDPVVWDPDHPGTLMSILSLEPMDVASHMSQNERQEESTEDPELSLKNETIQKNTKRLLRELIQSRKIEQDACTYFPVEPSSSFEGNLQSSQLRTELMRPELDLKYVFGEVLSTLKKGELFNPRLQQQVWSINDDALADLMLLISELNPNVISSTMYKQPKFFTVLYERVQPDLSGRTKKNQLPQGQLHTLSRLIEKIFSNDSHSG